MFTVQTSAKIMAKEPRQLSNLKGCLICPLAFFNSCVLLLTQLKKHFFTFMHSFYMYGDSIVLFYAMLC